MVHMNGQIGSEASEKERPKVLFVCHNHPDLRPGGAEGYALNLYETIRGAGEFEPVFLARAGGAANPHTYVPPAHRYSPVSAVNRDPNQYLLYTDLSKLDYLFHRSSDKETITKHYAEFLEVQQPDIVHFQHNYLIGYDFLRVTKNVLPDVPIVYMLHEYLAICFHDGQMIRTGTHQLCREQSPRRCHECFPWISPETFFRRTRFIKSHLSLVDLFIAPSEYVRDRYVDWGIPAEKVEVLAYAMPAMERPAEPEREGPRNRFAFFGQFTPYKGTDVLLKAMASLGEDFDGHLWIHGANLETQAEWFQEELSGLLEATAQTVTFAGPYDHDAELEGIMMETDWVMVPSIWWETGPLVVLEGFQHGRPVICSDIGGMSEKVQDGVSGLHFDVGDSESLAETIRKAAETPGLWEELQAGIPPVYDIRDHTEVVHDFYRRLLGIDPVSVAAFAPAREEVQSG
jgi:glycosyltransferase involved in cell wall biosynthesis